MFVKKSKAAVFSVALLMSSAAVIAAPAASAAPAVATSVVPAQPAPSFMDSAIATTRSVASVAMSVPATVASEARVQNGAIVATASLVVMYLNNRYNIVERTVGTVCDVADAIVDATTDVARTVKRTIVG